eukprot:21100-Heterococcus_DN1.PRE.2
MLATALGMLRARARMCVMASSAAETVLPPGVFITSTPLAVAAGTSMLSTPVPALPTMRRRLPASMTSCTACVRVLVYQQTAAY